METITVGGAMLGNCAIGRVLIPSTPRNRRIIEITIASAGRWRILVNMAARESRYLRPRKRLLFRVLFQLCNSLFRLTILVFHFFAVANLSGPLENDRFVRTNPLLENK